MDRRTGNAVKSQPVYTRRNPNEYGFYIACDDRSILRCVNTMLLNNGIVGLSDDNGRLHYLIDGRRGGNFVVDKLSSRLLTQERAGGSPEYYNEIFVLHAIDSVIEKYELNPTLIGTQIVRSALRELYYDPKLLKGVSKVLYPKIGKMYNMNPSQIERNIRYCIQKSRKLGANCRVLNTLRELQSATLAEIYGDFGR